MHIPDIKTSFTGNTTRNTMPDISTDECVKVINDVLPMVETFGPNKKKVENDKDFFRQTILHIFLQGFYKRWPDAYKLIMKFPLKIKIIHYKDDSTFDPLNTGERTTARYQGYDGSAFNISVNLYDYHKIADASMIYNALEHEVMHLISNLCYMALAEDENAEEEPSLAFLIDKDCDNILANSAAAYRDRMKVAEEQIRTALSLDSYADKPQKFYDEYDRIMKQNHCWAYTLIPRDHYSVAEEGSNIPWLVPLNSEEFLALGLQMFFGSDKQKKLLFEQSRKLYGVIEIFVLKLVKKLANKADFKLK